MSEPEPAIATDSVREVHNSSLSSSHHRLPSVSTDLRIMELEMENSRLQRLVAELLLKNQQLRKEQDP